MKIKSNIFIRKILPLVGLILFVPKTVRAVAIKTLGDFFDVFVDLINKSIIPLLFALAIVVFIWGIIQYMMGAADQTKREEGRKFILWGIIGIFVMVAIWGIIGILTDTFEIRGGGPIFPQLSE